MAQQLDQIEIAEAVEKVLELIDEDISLLELVQQAVPNLSEADIRQYVHFIVNGVKETDADVMITKDDQVNVIPCFAGG